MAEFFRYVSLNVLGMLGISGYILADTFFVANALGTNGLAALNLAIPVYNFIHGAGLMLGIGGAGRFALLRSRGQPSRANAAFTHALALVALLGALGVLLGLTVPGALAGWLGGRGEVLAMSATYLRVMLLFTPLFLLNETLLCFVRNDGAPHLAMAGMVGGSLANIALDYILIYPCGLGIFGAILATGIAPVVSMALLLPHLLSQRRTFHPVFVRPQWEPCRHILVGGAYSLLTEVSGGVVMMVCNGLILSLLGDTGLAAYGVVANIALVVTAVSTGIAQGIQPLVSRDFGLGRDGACRTTLRRGLVAALAVNLAVYGLMFFWASPVTALFNSGGDGLLQKTAEQGLRLYFLGCPFAGISLVSAAWLSGVGRGALSGALTLLRGFVVVLPLLVVLALWAGMTGLWLAVPAAEALVCLLALRAVDGRRRAVVK